MDSVWHPLDKVSIAQGGGCQAAEVGEERQKEGGEVGGEDSPGW